MEAFIKKSIGIDVSKDKLDFCACGIDMQQRTKIKGSRKLANSPAGIKEALLWVRKHSKEDIPLTITMEATGVYHEQLALALQKEGFRVSIVLPNKAKKYMESLGLRSKTDGNDAHGLARMGAEQHLERWEPKSLLYYELRTLTRHHEDLQGSITSYNNRLHAMQRGMYRNEDLEQTMQDFIEHMEHMVKEVEQQIHQLIKQHPELKRKVQKLTSIKGVGELTAATIIGETNGFALFTNSKQLEKYTGYDVVENQSGKRVGKTKISKKGNSHIRRILHMPALNAVTYNVTPFVQLYDRVFERTRIKMKGYVAVQRKLLVMMYTLWKKDEMFNSKTPLDNYQREEPKPSFGLASQKP